MKEKVKRIVNNYTETELYLKEYEALARQHQNSKYKYLRESERFNPIGDSTVDERVSVVLNKRL